MKKIGIVVIGYGHVGKGVVSAVEVAPDMELKGIMERPVAIDRCKEENRGVKVSDKIDDFPDAEVAILAIPTRQVPRVAREVMFKGLNTIDSFDLHGNELLKLKEELKQTAHEKGQVAIIAAGWDPGTDSMVRATLEIMAPRGLTYTNFGPGMSMGHTVAVKEIAGVEDALVLTIPVDTGIHRRMVYIQRYPGTSFEDICSEIRQDPYFSNGETFIEDTDDVSQLVDVGHGVRINRKGIAGKTHNQMFSFDIRVTNPAVTGQVMVSSARASMRLDPGVYTMVEIPPVYFLAGDQNELIAKLV